MYVWQSFSEVSAFSQELSPHLLILICLQLKIFLTAWPRYPLEDGERWPVGGSLQYNTVPQLDWFRKEQGKWVEVAYVLPFFSLRNMPDLCPKDVDLGVKPSAPSCPLCPRTWGSKLSKLKAREPPSEGLPWSQRKSKLRFKLPTWRSKQLLSQYDLRLLWFQ